MPITPALALKLKASASKGRAGDAPLLLQSSGEPWGERPSDNYREDIREVVKSIGFDPDVISLYSLRHSSIVRALLKHVSPELVAKLHDTSLAEISKHYAKYITETEAADDSARTALLHHEELAADNVVKIAS